jgi:truncated hemoglobin YjbI
MPTYQDVMKRTGSLLAMTGLTEEEFNALLSPFEQAFEASMCKQTIDGRQRLSRSYSTYRNAPLPTMADKLLFILTFLKQNPIQEVQGQLFGISQSNANKWIHLLHMVLNQALADQDVLPARTADELASMLKGERPERASAAPLFS